MQAIANVADRQPMGGWWEFTPGGRTHAIYDEVRRLDQARGNAASALAEGNAGNLAYEMA
jgi:hypothetical protein